MVWGAIEWPVLRQGLAAFAVLFSAMIALPAHAQSAADCEEAWRIVQQDKQPVLLGEFVNGALRDCPQAPEAKKLLDDLSAGANGGNGVRGVQSRVQPHAGAVGDKRSTEDGLPDFGPVPQWSALLTLSPGGTSEFLRSLNKTRPSLQDVGEGLSATLRRANYSDYGFYRTDGGFALVARLEKIDEQGAPAKPARFKTPQDDQPFGFAGFLGSLIYGDDGYYRVIVLVVTDRVISADGGPPSVTESQAWFVRAADRLPQSFATRPWTNAHRVTALIYEFRKGSGPDEKSITLVQRLTSAQHLRGAGLYSALDFDK